MNEGNGKIAASSQDLRSMPRANVRTVFGKGHITHRVEAIFDPPMSTAQRQEGVWPIRFRWQNGDEEDHLDRRLSLFRAGTSELGNMGNARPISLQISTKLLTHLDHTMLDAPTMPIKGLSMLKLGMRISKIGSQIGLQRGFVAFDDKKGIGVF